MSLADDIARTLPPGVAPRITRLADGPAVRPDLDDPRPDPTRALATASGAPRGKRDRNARGRWHHATPKPDGTGYTTEPPTTATPAPPRHSTHGPVTWPGDAHDDGHLGHLHAHRARLALATAIDGAPRTFAWTRPNGARVEWTAVATPRIGVETFRTTTRARSSHTVAIERTRRARTALLVACEVLRWHAPDVAAVLSPSKLADRLVALPDAPSTPPGVTGWNPAGTYSGDRHPARVLSDAHRAAIEAATVEHEAAATTEAHRWERRRVEVAHQRAERLRTADDETLGRIREQTAARVRRLRGKRRAMDFAAGVKRARKAATR